MGHGQRACTKARQRCLGRFSTRGQVQMRASSVPVGFRYVAGFLFGRGKISLSSSRVSFISSVFSLYAFSIQIRTVDHNVYIVVYMAF